MTDKELQDLIEQLSQQRSQKPGGGFGKVSYDPYQEFEKWNEMNNMFHGAPGAQASMLPMGGKEWQVSSGMLAANGAPKSLVQAADKNPNASAFMQQLQQMFGRQTLAQHPGIQNIDLNGLMGGQALRQYVDPSKQPLTPEEEDIITQAMQQRRGMQYGL